KFNKDQRNWRWFGKWVNDYHEEDAAYRRVNPKEFGKCQHAISIPGDNHAYEIGVIQDPEDPNAFRLLFDFYGQQGRKIEKIVGKQALKLAQYYQVECAKMAALEDGFSLEDMREVVL